MINDPYKTREAKKYQNPIASRECIIELIGSKKKQLTLEQIVAALKLTEPEQIKALHHRLRAMERDNQVIFNHKKYKLFDAKLLIEGKVIAHSDGYGFLDVKNNPVDLFISPSQMRTVLHGDVVLAQQMSKSKKGKAEVKIIKILFRRSPNIIARYYKSRHEHYAISEDKKLNLEIILTNADDFKLTNGSIINVELTARQSYKQKAQGKITELISNQMNTKTAINIALTQYEVPYLFSENIQKELANFAENVLTADKLNRRDLTMLPFITIDGEDAKDFDDAVYCKKNNDGTYQLYVAIADVSHYVTKGSELDKNAYERSTSVYFPTEVVPMLPEQLSNGLCSLNPHVDRLTLVCEMVIDSAGHLQHYQFFDATINSKARFTYNEVQQILDGNADLRQKYQSFLADINSLYSLYQVLAQKRETRGAIDFETNEPNFIFDVEQKIQDITIIKRNNAHKIIEECMILANIAAAKFITKNNVPCLYRIHDKPDEAKIKQLKSILAEKGVNTISIDPTTKEIAALIKQLSSRADFDVIQTLILRSLKQATYSPENNGHFGLALKEYAHFTSPIRRYPDLIVHRTIKAILSHSASDANNAAFYSLNEMLIFGEHCSMAERRAEEAVRQVMDYLKCEYMHNHIGDEFSGEITGVKNFGFFVKLDDLFIDGMVHLSMLDKDNYVFDEDHQRLIGERSRKSYKLGDKVSVQVIAVNKDERKIDFKLCKSNSTKSK